MKTYTVAVLGATGAVGQEMIKILQERNFPVGKLIPLASARSVGKTLPFRGEEVIIQEARDEAFQGVDIVLGAAENDIAKQFGGGGHAQAAGVTMQMPIEEAVHTVLVAMAEKLEK